MPESVDVRSSKPWFVSGCLAVMLTAASLASAQNQRLSQDSLTYVGAFRLPDGNFGSEYGFSFGGAPMTFNPANNSLFIGGHPYENMVAEVSIPTPVASSNVNNLPVARVLQRLADPTEGQLPDVSSDTVYLGGLLVYGGRLYGTAYIYYDADGAQQVSHFSRSLNLSQPSAGPMFSVGDPAYAGWVSGYMATVPSQWQAALGGPAVTGQCCIPIVSRTSWGPDAFAWDPDAPVGGGQVRAAALQYYDSLHPSLGVWEGSNSTWGGTTRMGGVVLLPDSATALFVGTNGTGPFCYGEGTDDLDLLTLESEDGDAYCYDPANYDKAQHAYPYNYQVWAYDLNDWAAVAAGSKQPWNVMPYGVWQLNLPTDGAFVIGGVGYDEQSGLLYISQLQADADGETYKPLVHVFRAR